MYLFEDLFIKAVKWCRSRTIPLILKCIVETWIILAAVFFGISLGLFIIFNADKLGSWWILLILGYMTMLILPAAYIKKRRELIQLHAIMGDKLFYELYPKELERDTRRKRMEQERKLRRAERHPYDY